MRLTEDVTITLSASFAQELLNRAGIETTDNGWALRDGSRTSDPRAAVTEALVAIGEDDLSATLHESIARLS